MDEETWNNIVKQYEKQGFKGFVPLAKEYNLNPLKLRQALIDEGYPVGMYSGDMNIPQDKYSVPPFRNINITQEKWDDFSDMEKLNWYLKHGGK